ncbi:MAG: hemerythrin [Candidatus Hydrogenedentes bacterium]|jgi:hemerythrin-like domain-containing protein|nr:hemerythrin [Candidatus Hydrogenedentota bacterium]
MKPTDILKHEHEIVLAVLGGAEQEAKQIKGGTAVDTKKVHKMLDFFRTFLDKCHHSKEERFLFPRLHERGLPREGGPISVMLHEHDLGRNEVKVIADALQRYEAGETDAAAQLANGLLQFSAILRDHIEKENNILFVMADRLLSPADQEELYKAFVAVESEEIGEGVHEEFHQFAHDLMKG